MYPSVYQSDEYSRALAVGGEKIVPIAGKLFAVERSITLPVLGTQRILEARGFPDEEELQRYKEVARKYFYGTFAPTVMRPEHEIFQKLGYHKIANHTILVDLQKSEEELWNALEKKSIRWGVKTALKNQVRIVSPTAKEVDTFYTLYTNRLKAGGVEPEAKESMHLLTSTNVSKLFVVLHGEDVVAGGMVLLDKAHHYAILDLTAASEKGFELQVMPYLYWQLMLFAKQHGMRYFDLGGYDVGARPGDKLYNINKFKERFGGRVVEQPIYATHGRYVSMRKVLGAFKFMRSWYRKE